MGFTLRSKTLRGLSSPRDTEAMHGRADVGDLRAAETLGSLARKVLSRSRHAESRELARVVLGPLAHWGR